PVAGSSTCSKIGCGPPSTTVPWSPCSSRRGSAFRARFSTTRVAATFRRPSAHAWISSRRRPRRYVHDHVTPENDHTSPLHTPKSALIGLGRDFVQVVL